MKIILKLLCAWGVANFLAIPLLWCVTWFTPERLEVNVKAPQGLTLKVGFTSGDKVDFTRVVSVKGVPGVQSLKAYFSDPVDVDRLAFAFIADGKPYEITSLSILRHCFFRSVLSADEFKKGYAESNGTFKRISSQKLDWHLNLGSDRRILLALGALEVLLFLVSFLTFFFRCGESNNRKSQISNLIDSTSVAAVASFLFCVSVPFQSFLANRSMFDFSAGAFWGESLLLFLGAFVFLSAALYMAGRYFGRLAHVAVLAFIFYEYLETGLLAIGAPSLNGEIAYYTNAARQFRDTIILASVIGIPLLACKWVKNYLHWSSLALLVLCLASLCDVKVEKTADTSKNIIKDFSSKINVAKKAVFSSKRNVIVLVLDSMTVDASTDVMKSDPELQKRFAGFTAFTDNLGMGPYTNPGLPGLMTGEFFDGDNLETYGYSMYTEKSFIAPYLSSGAFVSLIPALHSFGYSSRQDQTKTAKAENNGSPFSRRMDGILSMNLNEITRFRLAPFKFKSWYLEMCFMGGDSFAKVDYEAILFPLIEEAPVDASVPLSLHLYHTNGSHPPVAVDKDGNKIAHGTRENYEGLLGQTHYVLRRVAQLLDNFRNRGIYDNSAILICADHGQIIGKTKPTGEHPLSQRAFPLLWFKPEGANAPFAFDSRPTSHAKIATLVRKLQAESISAPMAAEILTAKVRRYSEAAGTWTISENGAVDFKAK